MGLDDLLARLERAAGTAGTADVPADVPANPLQTLAGTAGTAGTAEKDKGESDSGETLPTDTAPPIRATRWLLHYADREPMEVHFAPAADHAEALAAYRDAVAAEPVPERTDTRTATVIERDELLALIQAIYATDTDADRAEALDAALADPAGALQCYRAISSERGITVERADARQSSAQSARQSAQQSARESAKQSAHESAQKSAARNCSTCRHRKRPGLSAGYCGSGRDDLPAAYGEHHPLRKLPADMGASCASYLPHEDANHAKTIHA